MPPSTWKPDKAALRPPIYLSLMQQLEDAIHSGALPPHTRLPAQRELAEYLQVNLSTITRVLKLCEKKGLVYAAVGRGTFVSPSAGLPYPSFQSGEESIVMDEIRPFYQCNPLVLQTAAAVLNDRDASRLFQTRQASVSRLHRETAQKWLSWFHIHAAAEHILLASGTRSALALSFLALFSAGDTIAVDTFTSPAVIRLAEHLHLRLVPIPCDAEGMLPDALAQQFGLSKVRAVYLQPTCQNPTGCSISDARRKALAETAERYNLLLFEDDPYLFLSSGGALPFASILPEQTVHIHSVSKALAPLGTAFIAAPPHLRQRLKAAAEILPPAALLHMEIVSRLMESGTALQILSQKRRLAFACGVISRRYFPPHPSENPYSLFRFLPIPSGSDGTRFEQLAKSKGVRILCAEHFAVEKTYAAEHPSFRTAICSPASEEDLKNGLNILKNLCNRETL